MATLLLARIVRINKCPTYNVPRNPKSDQPSPVYEQKYINQLENEVRKLSLESDELKMKPKKTPITKETTKSFLDFFGSIPEYDEINHLSNKEFYKKLENLKEKQKFYQEYMLNEIKFDCKDSEWIEDYKNLKLGVRAPNDKKKKTSLKPFCTTPVLNKNVGSHKSFDIESIFSDKEVPNQPPSRRSVRIETPSDKLDDIAFETNFRPKSRANMSIIEHNKGSAERDWDETSIEDLNLYSDQNTPLPLETKSAPCSPVKTKLNVSKNDGITIPKPFQMTVRDEENKIVDELFLKIKKPKEEKPQQFKAHEIPIESQIPLFDEIMEDQERRSFITKEKRKAILQAQMKPFSFTKRDEEIQELTKQLSKSSPNLYLEPPLKIKKFKAKPIPKNLFSNYIYRKMHEDEFYRALQKKIRAEEMLRAASLPPSMAKREKTKVKMDVCPRSFRDFSKDEEPPKKSKAIPNFKAYHDRLEKELEELKNEFISTSPRPFKLKTSRRGDKKCRRNYRNSSASSKGSSTRPPSSLDLQSLNRSNLAAVLRIQSARQRLETEMMKKLEEAKLREEARWREKLLRKKPVWQALAYSHEEDLAMRLQLRRDEERLRNEEHRMRMHHMLNRVNQQPTLFERQSHAKFPKTRDELVKELHKEYSNLKKNPRRCHSDLSDIKALVEMKDEAIQAFLDEHFPHKSESETSKESANSNEEKEGCDCFSDNEK